MRLRPWNPTSPEATAKATVTATAAMVVGCVVLIGGTGCTGSAAKRSEAPSTSANVGTAPQQSGAGWVPPGGVTAVAGDRQAAQYAACRRSSEAKRKASAKNLPRATERDVQCLADSLTVADVSHAGTITEYRTVADPTTASRTLSDGILSGAQADLDAFDKAAYAKGSGTVPDFVVAIATPRAGLPDIGFLSKVMTGFQLTDLFTPPTLGANGQSHRLTIACGTTGKSATSATSGTGPAQKQTLCAWEGLGRTAAGEQAFDGALLFSAPMAGGLAESWSEAVVASLAPVL